MPTTQKHRLTGLVAAILWCLAVPAPIAAQEPPGVRLAEVERRPVFEETRLNGTVNAMRVSRLSTAVAGLVESVSADVGDTVAQGDALVTLDEEQSRHQLASAEAQLQEARASLDEARRRFTEARSVGAGRNIAETEIRARESAVAVARASVARAQAEVSASQTELDRHQITAPFDGVVSTRSRDIGEWVTPGDELMTLVDLENLRLDFQVAQHYFNGLGEDSELLLVSGPGSDQPLPLSIATRVPVTDPDSRTFLMRAAAPDNAGLVPGMSVVALLRVGTGRESLTIPRDAINRYPEGRVTVWIAEPADTEGQFTVTEKRIRTGSGFGGTVEVLQGLEAGQQVVSRGNESLDEGKTVQLSAREAR